MFTTLVETRNFASLHCLSEIYIAQQLEINSFQVLPIDLKHTLQTYYLPNHHKDPFDRILVAPRQVENLPLLTLDANIAQYGVSVIW